MISPILLMSVTFLWTIHFNIPIFSLISFSMFSFVSPVYRFIVSKIVVGSAIISRVSFNAFSCMIGLASPFGKISHICKVLLFPFLLFICCTTINDSADNTCFDMSIGGWVNLLIVSRTLFACKVP